jgi:hypothetical protein
MGYCDFGTQTCYCYDGWTGEFCDVEGFMTNSTEVDDKGDTTNNIANDTEGSGNGTTFSAAGVATRTPQNETGSVRRP